MYRVSSIEYREINYPRDVINRQGNSVFSTFSLSFVRVEWVLLKAGPRPAAQFTARGPLHGLWPSGPRPTQRPLAQRPAAHSTDQRPNFLGGFAKSRPAARRPTARGPVHGPGPSGPLHGLWPSGPRPTQRPLAQRPAAHSTDQRPNFFGQRLIGVHAQLWITVGFSTCKMDDGEFPFSFRFESIAVLVIVCFILLTGKRLNLCTCF